MMTFKVREKSSVKLLDEQVKSKFMVLMDNNKLYHEGVKLKFSNCCDKNNFVCNLGVFLLISLFSSLSCIFIDVR